MGIGISALNFWPSIFLCPLFAFWLAVIKIVSTPCELAKKEIHFLVKTSKYETQLNRETNNFPTNVFLVEGVLFFFWQKMHRHTPSAVSFEVLFNTDIFLTLTGYLEKIWIWKQQTLVIECQIMRKMTKMNSWFVYALHKNFGWLVFLFSSGEKQVALLVCPSFMQVFSSVYGKISVSLEGGSQ